jgi:hypothetical protein
MMEGTPKMKDAISRVSIASSSVASVWSSLLLEYQGSALHEIFSKLDGLHRLVGLPGDKGDTL